MSEVTQILRRIEIDGTGAADELLPLVYDQLRRLAASRMSGERVEHTLSATALVHEAYVRLVDTDQARSWENRRHFFAAAAEAMRRILVEHSRAKQGLQRGGGSLRQPLELDQCLAENSLPAELMLDLDEALQELGEQDAAAAELFKLCFFAGLSVSEAGRMLGLSRSAAYRDWSFARAFLAAQLQ